MKNYVRTVGNLSGRKKRMNFTDNNFHSNNIFISVTKKEP